MTDQERFDEINKELDALYQACAKEYAEKLETNKFDPTTPRGKKKVEKLAEKYAEFMRPLVSEQKILAEKINNELEEQRKSQYVDVAEAEKIRRKLERQKKLSKKDN